MSRKMHKYSGLGTRVLLLIISSTLLLAKAEESESYTSSFGQQCNETVRCDSTKSLNCSNGVCDCQNSQSMIYDSELSTCVVRANKLCIIENPVSLTLTEAISLQAPGVHNLSCVKNSYCDPVAKLCVCDELLMPSENGTCVAKKLFGEACSLSSDCRTDLGLACGNELLCVCDPETTIYDETTSPPNFCLGQAEKPCIKDICTSYANCVDTEEWLLELKDPSENETSLSAPSIKTPTYTLNETKKICQCADDYNPTPSGECAKDHGIKCDRIRRCNPGYICGENGVCECQYPTEQIYDEKREMCVSLVGGRCNSNITLYFGPDDNINTGCVVGAECVLDPGRTLNQTSSSANGVLELDLDYPAMLGSCRCRDGHIDNGELGCDLGYRMGCADSDDSNAADDFILNCHHLGRMNCTNNKCECEHPLLEYDHEEKVCVALAGSSCTLNGNHSEANGEAQPQRGECTKDAVCTPVESERRNVPTENMQAGVCKCTTRQIGNGKCGKNKLPLLIIGFVAVGAIALTLVAVPCFIYVKRQGYLIQLLS